MKRQLLLLFCMAHLGTQLQGMSFFRSDEENLLHCVQKGDYKKVADLLEKGVNPNSTVTKKSDVWQKSMLTPLMLAAKHNHPKIITLLLAYKADPMLTNDFGATALHIAALQGNTEAMEALLVAPGIEVDARDKYQHTPLMYASENGHVPAAQLLLDNKANINLEGITLVRNLTQPYFSPLSHKKKIWTALHYAAYNNQPDMVEFLINNGAKGKRQALKIAVQNGKVQSAAVLIKHGTPIHVREGYNLLSYAIDDNNDLEMVELLLKNGSDASRYVGSLSVGPHLQKLISAYESQRKASTQEKETEEKNVPLLAAEKSTDEKK